MIKGIYTSASGMIPRLKKQEVIANNISNSSTSGFKKDNVFVRELSRAEQKVAPKKSDWQTPIADEEYVDYRPGVFDRTDNPLDLAIEGDGFFTLQAEDGSTLLTRSGTFMVNSDGYISYPGGYLLTSEGGPIQVGNGKVSVGRTGEVEVDGLTVGRITPMTVDNLEDLKKVGRSLFAVPEGVELVPTVQPTIQQGYLETSNVDIISEMVDMIISYRAYEANAKAVQSQDNSLEHLFNRVGGR
ncbi:MAG: flagellar hook-basal body protein [candidate division Zixibacteria bacterium]|nr:flagellar hook-basal body protein [candidate division Zixibacteria bacterium]